MTFDPETSEMTLALLRFALDFAKTEKDVMSWFELNSETVFRLADPHKATLRDAYKDALRKSRKEKIDG